MAWPYRGNDGNDVPRAYDILCALELTFVIAFL